MRILIYSLIYIALVFPVGLHAGAGKTGQTPVSEKENVIKVVVADFYNYTGSSMSYLSRYIPERIITNLRPNATVQVMDRQLVEKAREDLGIQGHDLYSVKDMKRLLEYLDVPVGVTGRYLVQDSVVRLNFSIVNTRTNAVIEGREQELTINENFLEKIDKFGELSATWILSYGISGSYEEGGRTDQTIIYWVLTRLKESWLGFLVKNKWLYALLIVVSFYLVSVIASYIIGGIFQKLAERTTWDTDDNLLVATRKPLKWIIFIIGMHLAIIPLKLSVQLTDFLTNLFTGVIIAIATWMAMKVTEVFIRAWGNNVVKRLGERMDTDMVPFIVKIMQFFYILMAALVILSRFGIEIGPLIASFGVIGFAVGFAVKDTIANLIGGLILIMDESIAVGDKVMIDDDLGLVSEIGMRYTKLKTFDNEIVVIPNGELVNKKFKNFVLPDPAIRVVVDFGVAYGSDVEKVEQVVLDTVRNIEEVVDDPEPMCVMITMGDFSLNFQAKFWIPLYENQYSKQLEATKKIYNALTRAGIEIPFPTHTVYLHKTEK